MTPPEPAPNVARATVVSGTRVRPRRHRTHDLTRVALGVVWLGVAITARALGRTTWDLSVADLAEILGRLPDAVLDVTREAFAAVVALSVLVGLVGLVARRRWSGLGGALLAAVVGAGGIGVALAAGGLLVDPALGHESAGAVLDLRVAAGVAAFLGAARPWFTQRWRWASTTLLVLFVPVFLVAGGTDLASLLVALTAGHLAAVVMLLVVGTPSSRLPVVAVLRDLASRGLDAREIRFDQPGTGPFVAHVTLRGAGAGGAAGAGAGWGAGGGPERGLRLEVLSDDDRTADAFARLRRVVTLRRPGDASPFSSLRRAVEHEALVTLAAERAGVATPGELLVGQPASGWMMLGVAEPVGRPVAPDDPDLDDTLAQLWADLEALRRARVAHRAIRPDALALRDAASGPDGDPAVRVAVAGTADVAGRVAVAGTTDVAPPGTSPAPSRPVLVLTDFRSGQLAAPDAQLDLDLAQGLYTAALLAGPERAVRSAVAGLGPDLVVRGATGLGPVVVPRGARGSRRHSRTLVEEIREQVQQQCDVVALQTYQVARFSRRQAVQLVLLVALTYVALPLVGQLPRTIDAVRTSDPWWGMIALGAAALGPPAAALSLRSCTTVRLPRLRTVWVQVATSFVGTSTPASVGSLALNARYLTRTGGLTAGAASGVIALQSVVQVVTHLGLLALLAVVAGRSLDVSEFVPGTSVVLLVVALVLAVAGVVLAIPRLRRTVARQVRRRAREIAGELGALARRPGRLLLATVGSCGVIVASAAALWACVLAFGGPNALVAAAFVTMVGQTLATAAPTPGGVGAVEAALIGGLRAFGIEAEIAVPAAFLYRLLTCWIPVFSGYFVLRRLQHVDAV